MDQNIRINKYLASQGIASRRQIDKYLQQGLILLNGQIAKLGDKINPSIDKIIINGQTLEPKNTQKIYLALHKPIGYLSSTSDDRGRPTVMDLIKLPFRLYPVGRLDYNTSGLIILTNDGDLTLKLTHPRYHLPKTYLAQIVGKVSKSQLQMLRQGVLLEDGRTLPAKVAIIEQNVNSTIIEITVRQGKNRQIRRMCQSLNLKINALKRISIGSIQLNQLKLGQWRYLTQEEVEQIKIF